MADQYVKLPDGSYAKFPDTMSDADIQAVLAKTTVNPMNIAKVNGQYVPVEPEGSALGRFASGAAQYLNPVTAVEGIASAVMHPVDTAKAQWDALSAQRAQADELAKQGRYSEAVGHFTAGILPLLGPGAADAGETIGRGDIAGGLGKAMGLLAPAALPLAGSAVRSLRAAPGASAVADAADAAATSRIADVMSPKVGGSVKLRLGNMAMDVAPQVARETTAITRSGLAAQIGDKLDAATQGLDAAADSRLNARSFPTQPILDSLKAARDKLTAKAVDASQYPPERTNLNSAGEETMLTKQQGVPMGQDVVPAPNAARVAQIDKAISEVKALGPVAHYEALRRIRQAYDAPAKAVYAAAVTPNFLAEMGGKLGAADVTGSIRSYLAKIDPATAAANVDYNLWKTASDVIRATEETERARPTVGRSLLARAAGAAVGNSADGSAGATIGAIVGPTIERIANGAQPAMKLMVARQLASLADAIRAGRTTQAASLLESLKRMSASVKTKAVVTGNTLNGAPSALAPAGP